MSLGKIICQGGFEFAEISDVNVNGASGKRFMCVLTTAGCEKAIAGDPCTMCSFDTRANRSTTEKDLTTQIEALFEHPDITEVQELHIAGSGSIFDDNEVPADIRDSFFRKASAVPSVSVICAETRTNHLTLDKLKSAKTLLRPDQTLEIALGYESKNSEIRERILNKKITEAEFIACLALCKETETAFKGYVLIKPPPLTDKEAIDEAVETAIHIFQECEKAGIPARVAFEPLFLKTDFLLELNRRTGFSPPNLWTVVEVIQKTIEAQKKKNLPGTIYCAINDENLNSIQTDSCPKCHHKILEAINRYNSTQDPKEFDHLDCDCKKNPTLKKITHDVRSAIEELQTKR